MRCALSDCLTKESAREGDASSPNKAISAPFVTERQPALEFASIRGSPARAVDTPFACEQEVGSIRTQTSKIARTLQAASTRSTWDTGVALILDRVTRSRSHLQREHWEGKGY